MTGVLKLNHRLQMSVLFCRSAEWLSLYIAHVVQSDSIVEVPNKMKCCVEPEVLLISPIRKEAQNATNNIDT